MTTQAQQPIVLGSIIHISVDNARLPVGTVASRATGVANVRNHLTKVNHTMWREESGQRHNFRNLYDTRVIVSLPGETTSVTGTAESVEAEVEEMKQRIRTVIDDCIRRQGSSHARARDGAWMRLGLMPVPEVDTTIEGGSAFGLPVGSVVKQDGNLYYIHEQERRPQWLTIPGLTQPRVAFGLGRSAQVVSLGPVAEVIFYSADDLLNKVWQEYWPLKELHGWCSFVEGCMRQAGLNDPGPQPQEYRAVAPAIEIPSLEVGSVFRAVEESVIGAYRDALRTLPVGSLVRGRQTENLFLRSDRSTTGWVHVDDLTRAMSYGEMDLSIVHIQGQR